MPDIVRRDLMIQTVIQRSGLRAQAGDASEYDDFFDEASDADPVSYTHLDVYKRQLLLGLA